MARDALLFIELGVRQTDGLNYPYRLGQPFIPTLNPLIRLTKQG
jgi:hypothetical protein